MTEAAEPAPRVLEPVGGLRFLNLREIWGYRDLIYYLARREVAGRYAQSTIGVSWAILQPVLLAAVFSVFLGLLAKVPSQEGIPYPVFAVSGMTLWLFISGALQTASESTVVNEQLISKVYFPRVIIPFCYMFPPLVDFCAAFLVVVATMLIYGVDLHLQILAVPVIVFVAFSVVMGAVLLLSAANVKYRDVQQVLPFLTLVGLFLSPVTYPFDLVPEALQPLYAVNPAVGLLESFRWALFGTTETPVLILLSPLIAAILLLLAGGAYFQRAELTFADII